MRNSTTYKLAGPKTFRRASTQILGKWGSNLQNIEKSMREIYYPDGFTEELKSKCVYWLKSGDVSLFSDEELSTLRVFLQVDQSGAEALIVAYDCEALDYRKLFINNVKPHVYVALKLFKDVWVKKASEHGVSIDVHIMDALCSTPIEKLRDNPAWREIDLLIKDSDNWPITERYYYLAKQTVHCMDNKTEILTKDGWVFIDSLNDESIIMISNGKDSWFEKVQKMNAFDYYGKMLAFYGEEVNQFVTPNHKMVYETNGKQHIDTAEYVYSLSRSNIPTSVSYIGGTTELQDWQVKLLVAIQADGHIEPSMNRVRFKFAKDRKIHRLHSILKEGNKAYTFNPWVDETTASNIVADFGVLCPDLIAMFQGKKQWGSWLLNLSKSNLQLLVSELKYWDGSHTESYSHRREEYCSSIYINIDWMKTICHLVSKQGTIATNNQVLGMNNRTKSIASKKSVRDFAGKVYCPTVSTGMFLVRRNGKISLTHNSSNYDIQAPTFRMNVLEKSGGKIVIPKDESERFLLVYRSLFPEIPERNRRVQRQVEQTGIIYNLHGHPYYITNYNLTENNMKEFYAWGPQSTVAEITRIAYSRLQEFIESESKKWDIMADTHDSYLVQCPLLDVKECMLKMGEFINQPLVSPIDGVRFHMKSECNVGFNWSGYKKGKNEEGLQEIKW